MAIEDSDWPVSFPPTNWNGIRTTEVVSSEDGRGGNTVLSWDSGGIKTQFVRIILAVGKW
jgi:hypothetical protein